MLVHSYFAMVLLKKENKMKAYRILIITIILTFLAAACAPAATSTPAATTAPQASTIPDLGGRKIIVAVENAYPPLISLIQRPIKVMDGITMHLQKSANY